MAITLRWAFSSISTFKHVKLQSNDILRLLSGSKPKVLPAVSYVQNRKYSFFRQSEDSDQLYGSLTGVSNTGLKRGRGRGIRRRVDLNKGQMIGEGKSGMIWPGLNVMPIKAKQRVKMHQQTPNQEYFDNIIKLRTQRNMRFRKLKIPAIQRGWTGKTMAGMSIGPPDPLGDYTFEGFDTRILQLKQVANMTGTKKNKYRYSCMVVTGNKNGLGGVAVAKASTSKAAQKKAKNNAAQQLQFVRRFEDHTLYHSFYSQQTATKIFCYRKEEGYGLVCHRCLKTICETIGIHNMYAKVEGSTKNIQNLTKGFMQGLREQETHQELADRMKLHVVEIRKERDYLPVVLASPSDGVVRKEPLPQELKDIEHMYFEKLPLRKQAKQPFWANYPSHLTAETRRKMHRNAKSAKLQRILYGMEPEKPKIKKKED